MRIESVGILKWHVDTVATADHPVRMEIAKKFRLEILPPPGA